MSLAGYDRTTMARRARIEFSGALYHVIIRGNRQQDIFGDDRDRLKFLELVRRYRDQHVEVNRETELVQKLSMKDFSLLYVDSSKTNLQYIVLFIRSI